MSLLLMYRPKAGEGPPPAENAPYRTLLGVGMTLALALLFGFLFGA